MKKIVLLIKSALLSLWDFSFSVPSVHRKTVACQDDYAPWNYNLHMTLKGYWLQQDSAIPLDINASSLDELTGRLSQGFYTTFSTLGGGTRVLGLGAHLDRLYLPAAGLGLRPSAGERALRVQVANLAQGNLPGESRIRLILAKSSGDVYVGIQPFQPLPESTYKHGIHVITSTVARSDPRIKGTDFITRSADQRKLVKGDVFEILLTHRGRILEGMTSNFYGVQQAGGRTVLVTAQKGILLGVTRRAVLRLARGEGMSLEYRAPKVGEAFDEAFLTSSSRGVVPIISIDGQPVGQGRVGEWAQRLSQAYQVYVEARSEAILP